jgi:hypothetical protein
MFTAFPGVDGGWINLTAVEDLEMGRPNTDL